MHLSSNTKSSLQALVIAISTIGVGVSIGTYLADTPTEDLSPTTSLLPHRDKAASQNKNRGVNRPTTLATNNQEDLSPAEIKQLAYDFISMEVSNLTILGSSQADLSIQDIRKLLQNLEKTISPELFLEFKNLHSSGLLPSLLLNPINELQDPSQPQFTTELVKQVIALSKRTTEIMKSCGLNEPEIAALFGDSHSAGHLLQTFMGNGQLSYNLKAATKLAEKYPALAQQMEQHIAQSVVRDFYKLTQKAQALNIEVPSMPNELPLSEKVKFQDTLEIELYRYESLSDAIKLHGLSGSAAGDQMLNQFFDSQYKEQLISFRDQTVEIIQSENELRKSRGLKDKMIVGAFYSPEKDGALQPETIQKLAALRAELLAKP